MLVVAILSVNENEGHNAIAFCCAGRSSGSEFSLHHVFFSLCYGMENILSTSLTLKKKV